MIIILGGLKDDYGDCVVRAICKALDVDWLHAYDKLCVIGRENQSMPNAKTAYEYNDEGKKASSAYIIDMLESEANTYIDVNRKPCRSAGGR